MLFKIELSAAFLSFALMKSGGEVIFLIPEVCIRIILLSLKFTVWHKVEDWI